MVSPGARAETAHAVRASIRARRDVVVSTLGITETLALGSTSYLALWLSGLRGPVAGRIIDRHGDRVVLAVSSLLFAAGLVVSAAAPNVVALLLGWMLLGIGMGIGLYEATFATAARFHGQEDRNAITKFTLFAGFASTIDWRGAFVAWAVCILRFACR